MKIVIAKTDDNNILTVKDYEDIGGRGEIAHVIVELELIKLDLLTLWEECEIE